MKGVNLEARSGVNRGSHTQNLWSQQWTELASRDSCVLTAPWAGGDTSGIQGPDRGRGRGRGFPSMVLLVPTLCRFLFQSLAPVKYTLWCPMKYWVTVEPLSESTVLSVTYNTAI